MHNPTTEQMLGHVQTAKASAKRATDLFTRRIAEVQRKASRHIDLYGGTAVTQVAEIAAATRSASDELYASYQTLVSMLDAQCRPLLRHQPETRAIRDVYECIRQLNQESEISNSYSATVDGIGLGDLLDVKYFPSIENKMIQSFWENTYHNHPDRIAEERLEKQAKQKAEADAKCRREQLDQAYNLSVARWKTEFDAAQTKRWAEIDRRMLEVLGTTEQAEKEAYRQKYSQKQQELEIMKAAKANAETNLSRLGFFAFEAKSKQKAIIEKATQAIPQIKQDLAELTRSHEATLKEIRQTINSKKIQVIKEVYAKVRVPIKPRRPAELYQAMPENLRAILDNMAYGELVTARDVQETTWQLADLNISQVLSLLRKLRESNDVERIDADTIYFTVL